jgi:proline dehydrogenase
MSIAPNHIVRSYVRRPKSTITGSAVSNAPENRTVDSSIVSPVPNFDDSRVAYETKRLSQLVRAYITFKLCQIPFFVRHADTLLRLSYQLLGKRITNALLQQTFFGHFCAGKDEMAILPVVQSLERSGVGIILDFAAEDDSTPPPSHVSNSDPHVYSAMNDIAEKISSDNTAITQARQYDYESEKKCDDHVQTFLRCIRSASHLQQSNGFAAIKVTALGNPKILERMSRAIVAAQNLFATFDIDKNGLVSRNEFEQGYHLFFHDSEHSRMREMMNAAETSSGHIDYITWSMMLRPSELPLIVKGCKQVGPLSQSTPTLEEIALFERMCERMQELANEAAKTGTRLLVDAEQVRFQPAIDSMVLDLQRAYNTKESNPFPVVYNTYQCYLKDTLHRLEIDLERSRRYNYHFGAKLVRGAYLESERDLANTFGYPSPVHDTIEETHHDYNQAIEFLLQHAVSSDPSLEVMVASHNQESVVKALAKMQKYGIDASSSTICFAQLLGMSDNLTFTLGAHGYRAYKYVPYGEIHLVMPYLIRRANENSSIASGAVRELRLIRNELGRRIFPAMSLR